MEALKAGYNLMERGLIGHRYEDASEVMSIVQFLRRPQRMDAEPKMYWRNQEIRLRPLFGNRLEPQGVGYFFSPFNIP